MRARIARRGASTTHWVHWSGIHSMAKLEGAQNLKEGTDSTLLDMLPDKMTPHFTDQIGELYVHLLVEFDGSLAP